MVLIKYTIIVYTISFVKLNQLVFRYHLCICHWFKGRVHCISMQVVMNKYFLLNCEKKLAQIRLVIFEKKAKNALFNSENDVTEPKATLLQ